MCIKKRKRKVTLEQEFTVVSKDGPSVEVIEQKARQNNIAVFRKGHARNRLYFRCVPKKKDQFLKDIGDICFWESAVTLPNRILRHFRRKLLKTAVNRLDKKAAQATLKVLMGKIADSNKPACLTHAGAEPVKPSSNSNSATSIKPIPRPTIVKSVIHGLKNYVSRVRFFIKPKKFAGTAHA
jgi:hypothetical protein